MQARFCPTTGPPKNRTYNAAMVRRADKNRPRQGARLAELRKAAGLSQAELGKLIDESQQNIAYWELSDRPPRSDALPKLARVLGVKVEDLLDLDRVVRRGGPAGKMRKLFDEASRLPRRQQDKIVEFLTPLVEQYKRGAS
jgi:transcriptional regulator with XRE-family HTH domain